MASSGYITYKELIAIYGVVVIFIPWILLVSAFNEFKNDVPLGLGLLIIGVAGILLPFLSYLSGWWILTVIQIMAWTFGVLLCLAFAIANANEYGT